MTEHQFAVNVVARHHSWRSEEIAAKLKWEPYHAWSVGDRRVTPKGTELPGTRQDTMCSFGFVCEDDQLRPVVTTTIQHLVLYQEVVKEMLDCGGSLALNIRLNGRFNCNVDLESETLQAVNNLGITLSVECFPDGL